MLQALMAGCIVVIGRQRIGNCIRFANAAEAAWRLEAQKLGDQHVEASQEVWVGSSMLWAGMARLGWTVPSLGWARLGRARLAG